MTDLKVMAKSIALLLLILAQGTCFTFQKRFAVLNGLVLGTVDDSISDVSLLQCAVFCQQRARQNQCQTAGYDGFTGTCWFSLDSNYNVAPAPNDHLFVMEIFELASTTATTPTTVETTIMWTEGYSP